MEGRRRLERRHTWEAAAAAAAVPLFILGLGESGQKMLDCERKEDRRRNGGHLDLGRKEEGTRFAFDRFDRRRRRRVFLFPP